MNSANKSTSSANKSMSSASAKITPIGLTVGAVIGELRVLIDDMATAARDLSQDMRATVGTVEGSSSRLLSEMDRVLGNRLGASLDDLIKENERRIFTDAQATIFTMQRALTEIQRGVAEDTKQALYEASIVTWDAEHNLPCQDRPPRLVYSIPSTFRIHRNVDKPSEPGVGDPSDRRKIVLKIRGNYLSYGALSVRVKGESDQFQEAEVRAGNPNEFQVVLPAALVERLQGNRYAEELQIEAKIPTCRGKGAVTSSVFSTVKPPLVYTVSVKTTPQAKLPRFGTWVDTWYEKVDDCAGQRNYVNFHTPGADKVVRSWKIAKTNGNCNAYIQQSLFAGENKIQVNAHIGGCGKDCFLGICNCKGRGWLGYRITVETAEYIQQPLPIVEQTQDTVQSSYAFPYGNQLPAELKDLKCYFYARVSVQDGATTKIVELDYENRIVDGIEAKVNDATCDVNVEVPANIKVLRLN